MCAAFKHFDQWWKKSNQWRVKKNKNKIKSEIIILLQPDDVIKASEMQTGPACSA